MKIAKTVGYKNSVSKSYNDSYFQGQRILDLVLKLHSSTTLFVQRKVFLSVQISVQTSCSKFSLIQKG